MQHVNHARHQLQHQRDARFAHDWAVEQQARVRGIDEVVDQLERVPARLPLGKALDHLRDPHLVIALRGRGEDLVEFGIGARGDGQPITTLIELESGTQPAHYFAGPTGATLLLSGSGGYGFLATVEGLVSRNKGGKGFISLGEGESLCVPSHVSGSSATVPAGGQPLVAATSVACASVGGRVLTFDIGELKLMEKGGRGLMLIDLEDKDSLAGAAAYTRSVKIEGIGRGGKEREETLEIRSLNNAKTARAKKGKVADLGFKPNRVTRVE